MAGTLLIMALGIGGGIERANKVMMPLFFCLFVGLVLLAIQAVSEILKHVEGLVTASANGKEAQG